MQVQQGFSQLQAKWFAEVGRVVIDGWCHGERKAFGSAMSRSVHVCRNFLHPLS